METTPQHFMLLAYGISNVAGLLFLWTAFKKPRLARLMFALLFGWACWFNYTTSHHSPEVYLMYSESAIGFYKDFINGWFSNHITPFVTFIAIGQGLIAMGMLLRGLWVKLANAGVIIFLIGIAPLGWYAAFPFSIIVSFAAWLVLKKDDGKYLWKFEHSHFKVNAET